MYFWRIAGLKTELRAGPLPQGEALRYVLASMLLFTALAGMPGLWNAEPPPLTSTDWVSYVVTLLLLVLGTIAAYRANGGPVGLDFAARYFALGWVLGLRLVVLVLLPGALLFLVIAGGLVVASAEGDPLMDRVLAIMGAILSVAFEGIYYWRLVRHFRDVAL